MSELKKEIQRITESPAIPAPPSPEEIAKYQSMLNARRFDHANPPLKPDPHLTLSGNTLATSGNLMNIQAAAKAGKSAVVGAVIASMMDDSGFTDCFGFESKNTDEKAVLHFDTEQSRYDAHWLISRTIERANKISPPSWLYSYSMADMDIPERKAAIQIAIDGAEEACGGVFAIFIDGIADLLNDPNDAESSFALIAEMQKLAIEKDCVIITVLHENPSSDSGKTRGHLGSQLERKAETNLRLSKCKDGITTIFADRSRHCFIPKSNGSCFEWNEELEMHVSSDDQAKRRADDKLKNAKDEAEIVLTGKRMTHKKLTEAIMKTIGCKERTAKQRISNWRKLGIVAVDCKSNYYLIDDNPTQSVQ
jgi:hypothetical protein